MVATLFHDYTDPASAIAVRRVQRLVDEGLSIAFAGFEAVGVDATLPVPVEVLAALHALRETARQEGLELHRPRARPPTARAHVVGQAAERSGLGASWREVCYQAYWRDRADISDPGELVGLAVAAGLDEATAAAAAGDVRAVAAFRREVAGSRRRGIGGVPVLLASGTLVPGLLDEDDLRALAAL